MRAFKCRRQILKTVLALLTGVCSVVLVLSIFCLTCGTFEGGSDDNGRTVRTHSALHFTCGFSLTSTFTQTLGLKDLAKSTDPQCFRFTKATPGATKAIVSLLTDDDSKTYHAVLTWVQSIKSSFDTGGSLRKRDQSADTPRVSDAIMVDIVILVAMDHPLSFANDIEALGVTLVQVKPILFPELRYGVSSKDRIECTDGPPAKDQITDEAGFDVCGQLNVGAEEENPVKESIRTRKGECGLQVVGQRQGNTRSSSPLAKVYAWGLTDYELVIFIGLDYTVVKPIDELLVNHEVIVDEDMEEERREKTIRRESKWPCNGTELWKRYAEKHPQSRESLIRAPRHPIFPNIFTPDVMVLRPSLAAFKMLTLAIRDYKESDRKCVKSTVFDGFDCSDSGFFNAVFPQWEENHLMQLPISYAAQSHTLQQNGEPSGAIWDRWNRTWFAASLLTANDSSLLKISVNQVHPPVYIEGLGLASIVHNVIDYQSVCHNFAMTEDSWPIVPDQYLRKLINSFHENALQFLGESRNSSSFIGNYNPRNVLQIDSNICEKANTKAFQNHSDLQLGPELDLQSGIGTSSPKTSVIPEDEKWAFVTSISDDSDIDSENLIWAEILFQSWRKKHRPEDWQFVMIIPSSLSEHKKKRLMRIGYMLRETECVCILSSQCSQLLHGYHTGLESLDMNLTTPQEEKNHLTCSECFAGPVHAFGLAEYTKVVYLDIKSLVERSLKWIFMINPGNSPIGARLPYVNMIGTSVLLLKPSKVTYISLLETLKSQDCNTVKTLNSYFMHFPQSFSPNDVRHVSQSNSQILEASLTLRDHSVVSFASIDVLNRTIFESTVPLSLQSRIRQLIKESKYQIRKNLFTLRLQRISDLQDWIFKEVGPLVPKNERFALVDFPDHPNVGDHAIWLGEELFFKKLNTSPSFYCTAYESGSYRKNGNDCDFTKLRSVIGQNGTIFCHGGGNIRNIPGESEIGYFQAFRLSLIKAFPTNPIVILPQSINFEQNLGTKALSQTAEVFNSHKQLTLMVRDRHSLELAKMHFVNITTILCPDMAFMIGPIVLHQFGLLSNLMSRVEESSAEDISSILSENEKIVFGLPGRSSSVVTGLSNLTCLDAVWISRVDRETKFPTQSLLSTSSNKGFISPSFITSEIMKHRVVVTDWKFLPSHRKWKWSHLMVSHSRVLDGVMLMNQARIVVSDRLHAMILSFLMLKPIIAMDNDYGKLSRFYNTFLDLKADSKDLGVYWAESPVQARNLLNEVRDSFYYVEFPEKSLWP